MVDYGGRVETFVVPNAAPTQRVAELWREVLEVTAGIGIEARTGNNSEYFWGYRTAQETIPCTFRATNFHGDSCVFPGSDLFKADQIGRLLDFKVPPITQCQITQRQRRGAIIEFDGEVVPLGLRILKEHQFAWNLEGRILEAPTVTTWWIPYDYTAIMRYGHTVNTSLPEDPAEAEFPPEPWSDRVVIRIKSQASPKDQAAPLPADDPSGSSAPVLPSGWKGPALGQAPPISADASGLVGYHSQYSGGAADQGEEEEVPPDTELLRLRGESQRDEEVHRFISWTTRKDYQLTIGISLPIQDPVGGDCHEGQLWEEVIEELIITEKHAEMVYEWLSQRLISRSILRDLPAGMPISVEEVTVEVFKDGKAGSTFFTDGQPSDIPEEGTNSGND
jgi:hypothetical protein